MKFSEIVCLSVLVSACHSNAGAASPETPDPSASSAEAPVTEVVSETASEPPKPVLPTIPAPETPAEIKAPAGAQVALKLAAKGVQVYACGPKKDAPKEFEWSLNGPEATLLDAEGKEFGKHFAGPNWQAADGSKVTGSLKAKVDAPVPDAIPWLLLDVTAHEGEGAFAPVAFIQRVDTTGGKAPEKGCDKKHAKAEAKVDYTATYYFYSGAPQ